MNLRAMTALAAVAIVLAGCWSRIEVNDLALVNMAALDREENGDLKLILQLVVPQRVSRPGGGGAGAGSPVHVISATGRTVLDVVRTLQLKTPRRLYFAHSNIFLIGERLAKSDLRPVEDFLNRFQEIRLRSFLIAVRGDPTEIMMSLPELERLPGEGLRQLQRSNVGLVATIREYTRDRQTAGRDPVLPWVRAVSPIEGSEGGSASHLDFSLTGSALFAGSRLVGWLEDRPTRGLLLLQGRPLVGKLTASTGEGDLTVRVNRTSVRRQVTWREGRPAIRVQVWMDVTLQDLEAPLDPRDQGVLLRLEQAVQRELRESMEESLEEARQLGVDPFGLGRLIHSDAPDVWRRLSSRWREEIRRLPVSTQVQVDMSKAGLTNRSRATPDRELIHP